jgi:hypothetical protein
MKYYIISIIVIILILYISSCNRCSMEHFTNNSIFNNLPNVIMESNNIKKINQKNPGNLVYILEQSKFDRIGYKISFNIKPNKNYIISYWRSNDQLYDGSNYDMKVIANDVVLTKKGKVVNILELNNLIWKKVNYIINTNNIFKIIIELGTVGIFTKGKRYFADLQVEEILPKLDTFAHKKNLQLFIKLDSKKITKNNKFTDIISNKLLQFNKELYQNSYGINLNKSLGKLGNANSIMNSNSSIFFVYTAEENQNGSLFYIPANNDYNVGINLDIQSNLGSDNRISITIVDKNYIYDIGLIQNPIIFGLILIEKTHKLFINGKIVNPLITNKFTNKQELGTCPDNWMHIGNNKCKSMNINKGTCSSNTTFTKNTDKTKWASKCKTIWTNCKKLNIGEIAPNNKNSCIIDNNINYSNKPILINKDLSLTGRLHSIIFYSGAIDNESSHNIYNYLARSLLKLDIKDSICNRPSLYKKSLTYITPTIDEFTKDGKYCCPFNSKDICNNNCADINWKDSKSFSTINSKCKKSVNDYCKNNYNDQYCNLLRNNKLKKASSLKIVENNKKKSEFTDKECSNCDSKVDLSKYIRKDKVPCWGCNIDKIKNL